MHKLNRKAIKSNIWLHKPNKRDNSDNTRASCTLRVPQDSSRSLAPPTASSTANPAWTYLADSSSPDTLLSRGPGQGDVQAPGSPLVYGCLHVPPCSPPWPAVLQHTLTAPAWWQHKVCFLPTAACGLPLPGRFGLSRVSPEAFADGRRETIARRRCFLPFKVFTCAA